MKNKKQHIRMGRDKAGLVSEKLKRQKSNRDFFNEADPTGKKRKQRQAMLDQMAVNKERARIAKAERRELKLLEAELRKLN